MADYERIMNALRNAHDAGDAEAARRLARMAREAQGGSQPRTIATTADGGRIYETADGQRGYTSPGYSTTDPQKIAELMEGATPAGIVQQDFDRERIDANPVAARASTVAQGLPFVGSYVDEIYSEGRGANVRALQGAMEREKPGQALAGNVAGAVIGAAPLAVAAAPTISAAAPASIGGRAALAAGAGATTGAVEGAIYGAGEQQDGGRLENAKEGAMIGAGVGAVLGGAAPYASAGVRSIIQRFKGRADAEIAQELGVSREAARVIRDAIATEDEAAVQAALDRAGSDAMIADAGPATRQLLDASAQAGGGATGVVRGAVSERTQAASTQMADALDAAFGPARGEREIIDGIRSGSAPARSAAYDTAYSQPIDYAASSGQRLERLLNRVPASAIRKAQQIMDLREETSSQIMAQIADDGTVTFTQMPDVRQVHYIMQALDDMAKSTDGTGTFGRQNTYGASVEGLRSQIGQTLKGAVPEFAQAQDIAADTARQIEMTELGYTMLRSGTRREDVVRGLNGASRSERDAAIQGVRAFIDDTTANVARTITDPDTTTREGIKILRDLSSRANQTKLRSLLGQQRADALLSEIDQAATAFELRAAVAENSKTAVRQAVQDGAEQVMNGGIASTLGQGEAVNATKRLVQAMTGETPEAREIRRMGFYEDIARALTEERGPRAQRALRIIQAANANEPISDGQARFLAQTIVSTGVLAGNREGNLLLSR